MDPLGDLELTRRGSETLMCRIEGATGLLAGEIQVLEAVGSGADHVRAVAQATGQPASATRITIDRLLERDVLSRHRHGAAGIDAKPAMLHVTEPGQVILGQVEAIRLRTTDALLTASGRHQAEHLRQTAQTLSVLVSTEGRVPGVGPDNDGQGCPELPAAI